MSPDTPGRVVGRCTKCGQLVTEFERVTSAPTTLSLRTETVRRCGCGEWTPADPANSSNPSR